MTRQAANDIRLDQVRFRYDGGEAMLFDATLPAGTITAVMGPSGAGKSTLIALIAGFETPESGRILIGGRDVTALAPADRPVSMVFQDNNLFAHLDVQTNVALGIERRRRHEAEARTLVAESLERVGLLDLARRRPAELSGGERQRVALARALVRDRPVLLLDEPFAALGPALREEMLDLVRTLKTDRNLTVAMITHQPDDAARLADAVLFLDDGRTIANAPTRQMLQRSDLDSWTAYVGGRRPAGDAGLS